MIIVVILGPVPMLYVISLLPSSFHSFKIIRIMASWALAGISTATGFLCRTNSAAMPSMRNAKHVSVLTLCLSCGVMPLFPYGCWPLSFLVKVAPG